MTGEFIDEKTKKAREIIVQNLISKGNKSKKIITNEIKSIDVDRLIVQFKNQSQDQIINNIEPVNNKLEYILRTLRILRPLRSINKVERMKMLINAMIKSIPGLLNVVLFLGFVLTIFGVFGVN